MKSATKFLWEKTSSGKVVVHSLPYLMVHRCWGNTNPSTSNVASMWRTTLTKRWIGDTCISAYISSTITAKCLFITYRKSITRFPTGYRYSTYLSPKSPKGWLKNSISQFCESKYSCVARSICDSWVTCSFTCNVRGGLKQCGHWLHLTAHSEKKLESICTFSRILQRRFAPNLPWACVLTLLSLFVMQNGASWRKKTTTLFPLIIKLKRL